MIFTVPGKPVAKGRPIVVQNAGGRGVHAFTPEKTVAFESMVALSGRQAGCCEIADVAVLLDVVAMWPYPKGWSKRARAEAELDPFPRPKITKPDADNVGKAVADGLEGIAYVRDGQVWLVRACTVWGPSPATHVRVTYGGAGVAPPFPERFWRT